MHWRDHDVGRSKWPLLPQSQKKSVENETKRTATVITIQMYTNPTSNHRYQAPTLSSLSNCAALCWVTLSIHLFLTIKRKYESDTYLRFIPFICSQWPASVFNGSGADLACGLLITCEWSWGGYFCRETAWCRSTVGTFWMPQLYNTLSLLIGAE